MAITFDADKGRAIAELLTTTDIFARADMPEDLLPNKVEKGSIKHLLFLTLTVAIDYQRSANDLWEAARDSFDDPETKYLFEPSSLSQAAPEKIIKDMRQHKLSQKSKKDAYIWRTIGVTLYKKWEGDPRKFLQQCGWDAKTILQRLAADSHPYQGRNVPDWPYLRGDKIGPLWLRILKDNAVVTTLTKLDQVPIPVDIHVARSTLTTGVLRGEFKGRLTELYVDIRKAWFESVRGLSVNGRPIIPLDVDESLWRLSKDGCTHRDKSGESCSAREACAVKDYCVRGMVSIENGRVELQT